MPRPANFTYSFKHGGLMRCCLLSLDDYYVEHPDFLDKEGDTIKCKWCSGDGMILKDGYWEWNHPLETGGEE